MRFPGGRDEQSENRGRVGFRYFKWCFFSVDRYSIYSIRLPIPSPRKCHLSALIAAQEPKITERQYIASLSCSGFRKQVRLSSRDRQAYCDSSPHRSRTAAPGKKGGECPISFTNKSKAKLHGNCISLQWLYIP